MSEKYQQIAQILCDITDQLIRDEIIKLNNSIVNNVTLKSRIGSGLATYCKHEIKNNNFTITYGKKMIKSKFNQNEVRHWLTYREIIRRNYFDGETSLLNLLSHTICHEVSHFIQQLRGWHKRGSIHNKQYYQILDEMHSNKHADTIRDMVSDSCDSLNISLDFDIHQHKETTRDEMFISVNDTVSFEHRTKTHTGTVVKVNRKTVIIRVKKLFKDSSWKVPKQLVKNSAR